MAKIGPGERRPEESHPPFSEILGKRLAEQGDQCLDPLCRCLGAGYLDGWVSDARERPADEARQLNHGEI